MYAIQSHPSLKDGNANYVAIHVKSFRCANALAQALLRVATRNRHFPYIFYDVRAGLTPHPTHFNTSRIDPSLKLEGSLDRSEPRVSSSSTVYLIKYE